MLGVDAALMRLCAAADRVNVRMDALTEVNTAEADAEGRRLAAQFHRTMARIVALPARTAAGVAAKAALVMHETRFGDRPEADLVRATLNDALALLSMAVVAANHGPQPARICPLPY
jgi:hypothetical protein